MKLEKIVAERVNKKIYVDGDKIIKVFAEGYPKEDVLNEALNHARVEATGLPVPAIHGVTTIDGKWAIVTEYIKGKTLAELVEKDPAKYDEYLEMFVDLQMQVHEKRNDLLTSLKNKMSRKINQTDLDATTRYELHARLESMPKHKKVLHGDFNASNIIIKDDGSAYIIDWSHATQGNASADVARTYLLLCLEGSKEKAEKYMKLFCKKSNTARQYIDKWLPIVAASQSVKGKAEEKEMLAKWVDIFDFE